MPKIIFDDHIFPNGLIIVVLGTLEGKNPVKIRSSHRFFYCI